MVTGFHNVGDFKFNDPSGENRFPQCWELLLDLIKFRGQFCPQTIGM